MSTEKTGSEGYCVLACSHCRGYFVTTTSRRRTQSTIQCSQCSASQPPNQYRRMAEHPEREGAAELRARLFADDAGHGSDYAALEDYGVLADQLREQDWSVVDPLESSPHSPEFYETAVETACDRHRDAFGHVQDHPIGTNWYAEAAADAGVDHPGSDVVDELVERTRDVGDKPAETPLPDAGHLSLTMDTHISPACSITVDADLLTPTAIQNRLFDSDSHLPERLVDVLQDLASEMDAGGDFGVALLERGVTALDGAYARAASAAWTRLATGDQHSFWDWLSLTRSLGGQTPLDLRSTLDDIERGPIALFAIAGVTPTVEFKLEQSFFDAKSTQRERFLRHLPRLTPGFDVRIVGSRLTIRRLLDTHADELPASVSEDAQQRLRSRETASTITEQRAQAAADALEDLGRDHPAWDLLASLAATQTESRAYADLYADDRFAVSDSAIRRRIGKLRTAGLVESLTIDGDAYAALTPTGQTALDKHPEFDVDEQNDAVTPPSPSSAGWPTAHTSRTESSDSSAVQPSVSDPRNPRNSTVLPQRAQEGRDSPVAGDTDQASSSSSRTSASSPQISTQFLPLSAHHATAAAASSGHISLVERSLDSEAKSRDHRQSRFSYDEDRDEVVVSVDFDECIALTAVRLCDALLSDKALNQVLTAERVAGHPDGMGLDGLEISNPYVLRGAVCLGWLRDVDAEGHRFVDRLAQARRDLLAMTTDLYDDDGRSIQGEVASEMLKQAHGLMGVALRMYDLLGVDVVREIRFPSGAPVEEESRQQLRTFLEVATSVASRYGAYSGFRVLHEDRQWKRDQLISEPNIDPQEPTGTLLGSWVLSGTGVDDLEPTLKQSPTSLELQEDELKFSPFSLRAGIGDGNSRTAVAEAVARILSFKPELSPDRQAISLIAGLTSDVFAAAEATMVLNGALDDDRSARALDLHDVRYGLSTLDPDALLPEMGGDVVSSVVHALLDVQERVSTAELAELAGCDTRSLSTESNQQAFAELEAIGLLEREDLGDGRPTLWRVRLPFRVERGNDEPVPTILVDQETTPTGADSD